MLSRACRIIQYQFCSGSKIVVPRNVMELVVWWIKGSKIEREVKTLPTFTLHLSLHEVAMIVGVFVSESYKYCPVTVSPQCQRQKEVSSAVRRSDRRSVWSLLRLLLNLVSPLKVIFSTWLFSILGITDTVWLVLTLRFHFLPHTAQRFL